MKKGDLLNNIHLISMTMEGLCIAKVDGLVVFLPKGAPGDIVNARVTKVKKGFIEASILTIVTASIHRITPFCNHFGLCGGCSWQHVKYDIQLFYKQKYVQDSFERIGGLSIPPLMAIVPCPHIKKYRNRLDFTFTDKQWIPYDEFVVSDKKKPGLGFHLPKRFAHIFDVNTCFLQPDPSNDIRLLIKKTAIAMGIPFFNIRDQEGFLRTLTIRTTSSGEVMVILQVANKKMEWIASLLDIISSQFDAVTSINYVVNGKRNDTFYDLEVVTYKGFPYVTEWVAAPTLEHKKILKFRISPKSFYQTNSEQAITLYTIILQMCTLQGIEVVYDLYTGIGSIANFIADKARQVIGIELIAEAINDAKKNAEINHISNTHFFSGEITEVLDESFFSTHGYPDVIITDPPRGGMHKKVCQAILKASPSKIIYVSCNPSTQARDISLLSEKFEIDKIQPIDMFPHTNHVENVTRLILRKPTL